MREEIIETKRLILRPLTTDDADAVFEWAGDERVARYMCYTVYNSAEEVRAWLNSLNETIWGFVRKSDGRLIGSGDICPDGENDGYWGFGYNIRFDCWNMGYTTEAVQAMIQYAHDKFGAVKFRSSHAEPNKASGRVMEKCGLHFARYGEFKKLDGSCKMRSMIYEGELFTENKGDSK